MYPEDSEEELVFARDGVVSVSERVERTRSRSRSRSMGSVGLRMERTLSRSMGVGGIAGLEKSEMERERERRSDLRILKTTEISVTERSMRVDAEVANELNEARAWKRQLRGS
jgi:hypothetical protein